MVAICVAFAELQTDMSDFTTDLGDGSIHFFDFKNYAMHVLFPGVDSHDVMKERKVSYSYMDLMYKSCTAYAFGRTTFLN